MIVADFECPSGHIEEHYCHRKQKQERCSCGKMGVRIITFGQVYTGNQDAPWLKTVLDVVDKTSTKPHVQAFLKQPTRANYKAWMKGEGIKPADHTEHGSAPAFKRPPEPDLRALGDRLARRHFDRKRIEVRS